MINEISSRLAEDLKAVMLGIQISFPRTCGEERTEEAVKIIKDAISEVDRLTKERDAAVSAIDEAKQEAYEAGMKDGCRY